MHPVNNSNNIIIAICVYFFTDVMKIVCDKFPKTPADFASVWDQFETAALEKELPENMKSIHVLRQQLEEITTSKIILTLNSGL